LLAHPPFSVPDGRIKSPLTDITANWLRITEDDREWCQKPQKTSTDANSRAILRGEKEVELEEDAVVWPSKVFMKADSHLAVCGSVKARGGMFEVLTYAESVALAAGLITTDSDYSVSVYSDKYHFSSSSSSVLLVFFPFPSWVKVPCLF
jgi:hypothetical protein